MILSLGLSGLSEASVSSNPSSDPVLTKNLLHPINPWLIRDRFRKSMSQEIEFRGYFLLKGSPTFVFSIKSLSMASGWV